MDILWDASDTVAIAVSGGVDSMVLLDKVRASNHYQSLYVLHVNHQLREASRAEAQMIERYCKRYNITYLMKVIPEDTFDLSKSIQKEARNERYEYFDQMLKKHQIDVLLTAHHQDDQTETIFFRLMTNRYHFQPVKMEQVVFQEEYKIIRPLLNTKKQTIIDYARKHHVPYMDDATNYENKYSRNTIRNEVLPVIRQSGFHQERLLDLGDYMEDVSDLVSRTASCYSEDIARGMLRRTIVCNENPLVVRQLLLNLIHKHFSYYEVSKLQLDEIIRVAKSEAVHASFEITPGWHIQMAYDKLIVHNNIENDQQMLITLPGKYHYNGYEITIEAMKSDITVRSRTDGDTIKINGQHQKVSRIMKDLKIPVYERSLVPIITINREIIAIGPYKFNEHPVNQMLKIQKEQKNDA